MLERYAGWLAGAGVERGLIGPREAPRLWERHLLNCGVIERLISPEATVCDVGTGAGLPGLVLAAARPDLRVTLVEPLLRRVTFLEEVVADLELDQVEVVRGRADDLHGERGFDVVTSRAVAPLERLLRWCLPLVGAGGEVLAMKGSSAAGEVGETARLLAQWGTSRAEVLSVGEELEIPTALVRVVWQDPTRVCWRLPSAGVDDGSRATAAASKAASQAGRVRPGRRDGRGSR